MSITGKLEEGCTDHLDFSISDDGDLDIDASVSGRSIAFSLNRIANALEASNDKLDIIANSISRGFRELKESVEDK